jgi:hypothetical protein
MTEPSCVDCGVAVRPNDSTIYHRVEGWERYRAQGGANQITFRKEIPEYLCGSCMALRRHGVAREQGQLFS